MEKKLKIALIHLNVKYKDIKTNCRKIIQLNKKACENNAKIIVNTEMAVSGYSFLSRKDIEDYVLTSTHDFLMELMGIAVKYGAYICLGFAEKDQAGVIFHNSAFVISPIGKIILKYHKINAETRWACPGNPLQNNVFETPWAKIGVLICSDTYHGLLVRQTALKGADIILVPANWPFSGLDPKKLWASRARENGVYIAACNRGGKDRIMDCDNAPSCLFSPGGEIIVTQTSAKSKIIYSDIPLNCRGRVSGKIRHKIMDRRTPENYGPIYLDMRHITWKGGDLTSYYDLGLPAPVKIVCYTGENISIIFKTLQTFSDRCLKEFVLLVFPVMDIDLRTKGKFIQKIIDNITSENLGICFNINIKNQNKPLEPIIISKKTGIVQKDYKDLFVLDIGPCRIGMCIPEEIYHPETGLALSKLGCDILISSMGHINPNDCSMFGARSLDKICVGIAGLNIAMICQPPEGHAPWKETIAYSPEFCKDMIDLKKIRNKNFQDRVDFKTLLSLKAAL